VSGENGAGGWAEGAAYGGYEVPPSSFANRPGFDKEGVIYSVAVFVLFDIVVITKEVAFLATDDYAA